jgi:hypothetical protein
MIVGACAGSPATATPSTTPRPDAGVVNGPTADKYVADVDHPLQVTIGETPTPWDVPAAPILPGGHAAVRFALIPTGTGPAASTSRSRPTGP